MAPKRDVAIYSPASSVFFGGASLVANEQGALVYGSTGVSKGGGAELQMSLLARGLNSQGLRTAIILWPIDRSLVKGEQEPDLVERPRYAGTGARAKLVEARHIFRAMTEADARAYVFRGGGPQLLIGRAFCLLRRRRLIFSAASDLDFDFDRPDRSRGNLIAYRAALRGADTIVVQRGEQADLARDAGLGPIELIPSFAEPAEVTAAKAEAFLWIGRLVDYRAAAGVRPPRRVAARTQFPNDLVRDQRDAPRADR